MSLRKRYWVISGRHQPMSSYRVKTTDKSAADGPMPPVRPHESRVTSHESRLTHSALSTQHSAPAFTLIELMIVLGLLAMLAFWVMPNFRTPLERSYLPESGGRFRTLIGLTRANAMLDGMRYRIRFLDEDEEGAEGLSRRERLQPLVEIERDPFDEPGEFTPVKAAWATSEVFLGRVWCYQVRIGRPTIKSVLAQLEEQEFEDEEERKREIGLDEDEPWVLILNPDGTSEWMTFRLVDVAREDFDDQEMEQYPQLDVILDGRLGTIFLQRPLDEEEVEILLDKGHSPILRRDFLTARRLTEDDVIEIDMRSR